MDHAPAPRISILHGAYYAAASGSPAYEYHPAIGVCECGSHVLLTESLNPCLCGRAYDGRGYPAAAAREEASHA